MTCMCIRHAKKSVFVVKPNPILDPKTNDDVKSVLEWQWQWQNQHVFRRTGAGIRSRTGSRLGLSSGTGLTAGCHQ